MHLKVEDVIMHNESKSRYLVRRIVPYNIVVMSIWGFHCRIGKRSLGKYCRVGRKSRLSHGYWFGEVGEEVTK